MSLISSISRQNNFLREILTKNPNQLNSMKHISTSIEHWAWTKVRARITTHGLLTANISRNFCQRRVEDNKRQANSLAWRSISEDGLCTLAWVGEKVLCWLVCMFNWTAIGKCLWLDLSDFLPVKKDNWIILDIRRILGGIRAYY